MRPISHRKANGVFYTPMYVAQYIVARTLEGLPKDRMPKVLDPACGDGVFLQAVYEELLTEKWQPAWGEATLSQLARQAIFGIDRDSAAIDAARGRFSNFSPSLAASNLRVANALDDDLHGNGQFDAIVGNPPYVNIRVLSRTCEEGERRRLRERYQCARGAYDLYVLFMERANELLRPGGVCGMIVPNKIATLDYALRCRELLLEHASILHVADVTELGVFQEADVYPYILVWRKQKAARAHSISVITATSPAELTENDRPRRVLQDSLSSRGFAFHGTMDIQDRVPTKTLGQVARLHSGTAGFVAQRVAEELSESDDATHGDCFDFIVSGNIDPYTIRHGDVRYMKRRYARPVLRVDAACLSATKRTLFTQAKIVIAGMTRRLEAAFDPGGLALGVQVYAASEFTEHPFYVLGLLNSKLLSHLFRLRFQAKRLSGGYLAINKSQLAQLPIRIVTPDDEDAGQIRQQVIELVAAIVDSQSVPSAEQLHKIDELVFQLYGITAAEIVQIESSAPSNPSSADAA